MFIEEITTIIKGTTQHPPLRKERGKKKTSLGGFTTFIDYRIPEKF